MEKKCITLDDTFLSPEYTMGDVLERDFSTMPIYATEMMICVDSFENALAKGRLYSFFLERDENFESLDQLLFGIEDIVNQIGLPKRDIQLRQQIAVEGKTIKDEIRDQSLLKCVECVRRRNLKNFSMQRGMLTDFHIKIYFRKNSSIQGLLSRVGKERGSIAFRSGMELLILLRNTLSIEIQNRCGDVTETCDRVNQKRGEHLWRS